MTNRAAIGQLYTLENAARLVGKTTGALRKRVEVGSIEALMDESGTTLVRADRIEIERAELLARMGAIDARPGHLRPGGQGSQTDEIARLRAEIAQLRAAAQSLVVSAREARDATRSALRDADASLDAAQQFLIPDPNALVTDKGGREWDHEATSGST